VPLIALRRNSAGDVAMRTTTCPISRHDGELMLALNQLQLALAVPKPVRVQRARFQARLEELREYLRRQGPRRGRPSG